MRNLSQENAFTGIDVIISIGIIMVFVSVVAAVYMNLNRVNNQITRMQTATNYAIAILEKVDELYYAEINDENFKVQEIENGKHEVAGIEIAKEYNVNVTIEKYSESEGQPNGKLDVVKTVVVDVEYYIGRILNEEKNYDKKTEKISMKKIKTKEILKTPNSPILDTGMIPVKYNNDNILVTTTQSDPYWYEYKNGIWAITVMPEDVDEFGSVSENALLYAWIPKFAYSHTNNDIKFIYANGEKYVDSNGDLQKISLEYEIPSEFTDKKGFWIELDSITNSEATQILSSQNNGINSN